MRPANAYSLSILLHASAIAAGVLVVTLDSFDGAAYPLAGGGGGNRDMPPGPAGGTPSGGAIYFQVPALKPVGPPAKEVGPEFLTEAVPLVRRDREVNETETAIDSRFTASEAYQADDVQAERAAAISVTLPLESGAGGTMKDIDLAQPAPKAAPTRIAAKSAAAEGTPELAEAEVRSLPSRQVSTSPINLIANAEVPAGPPVASGPGGTGGGVGGARGGAGGGGGSGGQGFGLDGLPRQGPANLPPLYPSDALLAGVEGRVLLRVLVTEEGRVEKLAVERSAGWPSLDRAALAAVRNWRFFPARRAGVPVPFEVIVPVRFSIRDR